MNVGGAAAQQYSAKNAVWFGLACIVLEAFYKGARFRVNYCKDSAERIMYIEDWNKSTFHTLSPSYDFLY